MLSPRALRWAPAPLAACVFMFLLSCALAADEPKKAEAWRDHTLNQAGPSCIAEYYRIAADEFPSGDPCEVPVQQAFAGVDEAACPANMTVVQQCLGKTSTSADAFTALVARCPLLNVRTRDPALPPVDTGHFSCFGTFEDAEAFRGYANGSASAPKGSYAAKKTSGAGGSGVLGSPSSVVGVVVAALAVAGAVALG